MARGAAAARQKHLVTMPEITPGVIDYGADPTLGIDLNTDGNALDFIQRYSEHLPDGFLSIAGAALVGDEAQISANFMPHYETIALRLNAICGEAFATTVLPDGRTQRQWRMPEFGRVDRETFSGYYGAEEMAAELLYGKIVAMSIESARGGDVSGNLTMHFNKIRRALPMLSTVAANAQFTVRKAAGTTGDVTIDVSVDGGAPQTLTITDADDATAVTASVTALSNVVAGAAVLNGEVFTITITDPANTRVSAYKATGAAGWTVLNTVLSNDGVENLQMPDGPYLESTHALVYLATDYADLQTIDMGDDVDWVHDDPHIMSSIQSHSFSMDALVNPLYFEDRALNPASHVDGETNITASYTLPEDIDGDAEHFMQMVDGCSVTPFYTRHAYRCGEREFWIDLHQLRNAAPDNPTDNNVAQRAFGTRRAYNGNGSLIFTLILP